MQPSFRWFGPDDPVRLDDHGRMMWGETGRPGYGLGLWEGLGGG